MSRCESPHSRSARARRAKLRNQETFDGADFYKGREDAEADRNRRHGK